MFVIFFAIDCALEFAVNNDFTKKSKKKTKVDSKSRSGNRDNFSNLFMIIRPSLPVYFML